MRIDRHAAAIVGDAQKAVGLERHIDEGRMAGDGLIHRIVEHFGEEVVQRRLVRAADIHARPAADGLQPLQNLDRGGRIASLAGRAAAARGVAGLLAVCLRGVAPNKSPLWAIGSHAFIQ